MSYRYKVKTDQDGNAVVADGAVIPNIGQVKDGFLFSPVEIENPNFELVTDQAAPTHLSGVVPQSAQPPVNTTTESETEQ